MLIFPRAGPDMKYFLGFVRTQLGTTTTILLVFGSKFLHVIRGTADELDTGHGQNSNTTSMFGVPFELSEPEHKDVYEENEELKEEIQKLAGQLEYLKIVGMLIDNRHVKPRKDGYFSRENCVKHLEQLQQYLTQQSNGSLLHRSSATPTPTPSKSGVGTNVDVNPSWTVRINGDDDFQDENETSAASVELQRMGEYPDTRCTAVVAKVVVADNAVVQ